MKKKLLLLSLSALGAFALPSVTSQASSRVDAGATARRSGEYERGYNNGKGDAIAAKCTYFNNWGAYENWYEGVRTGAWNNMASAGDPDTYDFWYGYWSGLEEGYYTQVPYNPCNTGGGPGGGTGPIPNEPYIGD